MTEHDFMVASVDSLTNLVESVDAESLKAEILNCLAQGISYNQYILLDQVASSSVLASHSKANDPETQEG